MNTRHYTNLLLERVEEGQYDKDHVIMAFCKYCSEDEVKDLLECNDMLFEEDETEEEEK